jgi:hypothetical protein
LSTYLFSGLTIISNFVIPELPFSNHNKGEFLFNLESAQQQSSRAFWSHHWLSGSEQVLSYSKQDSYHWLRFPGLADFRISDNVKEISCYPTPETTHETVRHLLLDQVLPRCMAHRGKIMLHASAVWLEEGSLLFIGESRAGKSTLAGYFHKTGQPVMSDDVIWIKANKNQILAVPSYGGLRLWEDSLSVLFNAEQSTHSMAHYSAKKRVPLGEHDFLRFGSAIPILALIVLSPPSQSSAGEIRLDPLSHREAFVEIGKKSFQLYLSDPIVIRRHMQALGRIVSRVSTYRLCMPHDYDLLPAVRQKILETVM